MDQNRFDAWTLALRAIPSRRDVLGGLAGAGLWLGAALLPDLADAKKRKRKNRKKKRRLATPNEFGCLEVGDPCTSADQCCSSICEGKKGRKACRAHDSGGCAAGAQTEGCGGADVPCTTSFGLSGRCATTTGNAGYCQAASECFTCKTDADCRALLGDVMGPNAACIRCAECAETGGAACAVAVLEEG